MAKGERKLKLNLRKKQDEKITEKNSPKKEMLTYRTTILDKFARKISFETLDISSNFSIHEDTAFAKEGYIRVYNIIGYPAEVFYSDDRGFLSAILDSMKNSEVFEHDVDLYYECLNKPYKIVFDQKTKNRYKGLEKMESTINQTISENSGGNKNSARDRELKTLTNDGLHFRLNEITKKKNSYNIIRDNQYKNKAQIESYQFIRMVCKKKSLLDVAEKELTTRMKALDISLTKVRDLSEYFETFSPVSGLHSIDINNDFASTIFTSKGYSKIRNKPTRIMENELEGLSRLIHVGTDIETLEPLGLSFTSSGDGQSILIAGTSGSGKTYLYENLMMNASLNEFKINAMDYKGNEYASIAEIIPNSICLDFGMDSPYFINTLKFIPELYEKEDWKRIFASNTDATVRSLRILAGIPSKHSRPAENAIENMIKTIYNKHKVDYNDIESYYNTKYIDYRRDIEEGIAKFQSDSLIKKVYGEDVCREIYSGLISYFSPLSHRSYMFEKEIDLMEVLNKDCIIYEFNMNQDSLWNNLVEYKIYNFDFVSNLFIQKNKRDGYSTLNSLEEYQRAVNSPELRTIYNNKFSGGRSDNVINVVLTNTIQPLLDKSFDISAIRENIATVFVGKLKDMDALDDFCRTFNIGEGKSKIIKLQDYRYAFYADYQTGKQHGKRIIKAIHPEYISKYLETKKID